MGMIEQVARALCDLDGRADPEYLEPGDALGIDGYVNDEPCHFFWRHFTEPAVTAIKAMRELTPEVVRNATRVEADAFSRLCASWLWQDMIDAALAEE